MPEPRRTKRGGVLGFLSALTGGARRQAAQERALKSELRIKRLQAQVALASHAAARVDRLTKDWRARIESADASVIPDLPTLQARARAQARDDAYATSAVRAFKRNVVGTGINGAPARRLAGGGTDEAWNVEVRELWREWSESADLVDVEGRRTFVEIQRWAIGELITVGEALIIPCLVERAGMPQLALQCIEAEQLDTTVNSHTDDSGVRREVRGGVEIDEVGRAVAYHLLSETSGSRLGTPGTKHRVLASRVLHLMEPGRARQTRATGRLTPVLLKMRNLSEYDYAQLTAARAEACMGLIITRQAENGFGDTEDEETEEGGGEETTPQTASDLDLAPVTTFNLNPGETASSFVPQRPGSVYQPFTVQQLKAIAAGTGLSYEQLARDFTFGNFSSQRQAMLEDRREFKALQKLLITQLCQPVFDRFVEDIVLTGLVRAVDPAQYVSAPRSYRRVLWIPDGWQWIDPEKEINSDRSALEAGLTTLEELQLERGKDWREVWAQTKLEREVTGQGGTSAAPAPAPAAPAPAAAAAAQLEFLVALAGKVSARQLTQADAREAARLLGLPDASIDAAFRVLIPT